MPVDVELGVIRKVGAELQEEGTEVFIDAVKVIVVDHRATFDEPGISLARLGAATALGADDLRLLLRLADVKHALAPRKALQVLLRDIVLALPLLEAHQIDAVAINELLDAADERLGHRRHGRCRGIGLLAMLAQVPDDPAHALQDRDVDVEVHPVDPLQFEGDVVAQDVSHRSCYGHRGLRSSTGPRTHRASRSYIQGMLLKARPESTVFARNPPPARSASPSGRTAASHHLARLRLRPTSHDRSPHTATRLVGLRRSLANMFREVDAGSPQEHAPIKRSRARSHLAEKERASRPRGTPPRSAASRVTSA